MVNTVMGMGVSVCVWRGRGYDYLQIPKQWQVEDGSMVRISVYLWEHFCENGPWAASMCVCVCVCVECMAGSDR